MPDTVLATVANGRLVTLSGFHAAWRAVPPPDRPDSLTPEGARKFLDLLIAKEALAEAALAEKWVWSQRDSAEYQALRDGLTMRIVLDSALTDLRRRMGPGADSLAPAALGVAARESSAAALRVAFDTTVTGRLARAFAAIPRPAPESSMMAQLRMLNVGPVVAAEDRARIVARTREGPYLAGDMLATWLNLNPAYRPRIETREQVEDVVKNQLFERELRQSVERRRLEQWPAIAAQLDRKREFIAVQHLVARDVYDRIAMDSLTLQRYYTANRSSWDLPLRVAIARLVAPSRREAQAMAVELADAAKAESLIARGRRAGARYAYEITEESDSAVFRRAMSAGTGKVLGPDSVAAGWQVVRVLAVQPPRSRTFAESRMLVANRWYGVEGERLMQELMDRARRKTRVRIHDRAVARLTSP